MALVKCKECGEKVSTKAKACPTCGGIPPKKTSRFTWLVLILMALIVALALKGPASTESNPVKTAEPSGKTKLETQADAVEIVLDVPSLVGKSKAGASKILGEPISCSSTKYGEKCQFKKAETEIVFINGKADWITIQGLDDKPFADETIQLLGFKAQKPSFSNSFIKRWEPLQGLVSVSLFQGSENSDYAYVKAYTQ